MRSSTGSDDTGHADAALGARPHPVAADPQCPADRHHRDGDLVILSEMGVDIAPLLAGAGVIGLAVGFGAQSLVKDVIAGAFFMFEGTINIGDVIDIGGKSGLVEGMTIRTMRLRDLNGSLHTVNFGSVAMVTNMTREFSYYVLDTKISYQYDPDDVMRRAARDRRRAARGFRVQTPHPAADRDLSGWKASPTPASSSVRASGPGRSSNGTSGASSTAA